MQYKYWVALFFTLTLFMDFLDATIVNVAMPTFASEFHAGTAQIQWISTIYLLAIAMFVLVSGWAGDRFGTKRIFLLSVGLFTIGSLLCAVSNDLYTLIASRALQGIGGGMMGPVGSSMMMRAFPAGERAQVSGMLMVPSMLAPVLAPSIGGYLVQYHSWHWIFGINVPVGLASLVAALLILREDGPADAKPLDIEGFVVSGVALMGLFYGLNAAAEPHVGQHGGVNVGPWALGLGASALVVFLWRCGQKASPLVDLRLFDDPLFRSGAGLQFLLIAGLNGSLFVFTLCEQQALHGSPVLAGMLTVVQAVGSMVLMPLAGRYSGHFGVHRTVLAGMALYTVATLALVVPPVLQQPWLLVPALALRGAGLGMCLVLTWSGAFTRMTHRQMGRATATMSAMIQLGGACGIAAAAAALTALQGRGHAVSDLSSYRTVFAGFVMLGVAAYAMGQKTGAPEGHPEALTVGS